MTATKVTLRKLTRLGRLRDYVRVEFPPLPMLVGAFVAVAVVYFTFEAIAFGGPLAFTTHAAVASFSAATTSLSLRIYDELKDLETDRRLAARGDPKYLARPMVQGLVDSNDLVALRNAAVGAAFVMNVLIGPLPTIAFTLLTAAVWVSSRWFFWPRMRDHLLIAFVTHNPLTTFVQGYVTVVYVSDLGVGRLTAGPIVAMLVTQQGITAAWEVGRKTRAPEQETDYVTYSRVLGWKIAPLVPAVGIAAATVCLAWLATLAQLSPIYEGLVTLAGALTLGVVLRFRVAPTARSAKALRPTIEGFAATVNAGAAIALVARWGMTLTSAR